MVEIHLSKFHYKRISASRFVRNYHFSKLLLPRPWVRCKVFVPVKKSENIANKYSMLHDIELLPPWAREPELWVELTFTGHTIRKMLETL